MRRAGPWFRRRRSSVGGVRRVSLLNLAVLILVVLAVYLGLERLVRSPWGRVLRAIREDEAAALALREAPARV